MAIKGDGVTFPIPDRALSQHIVILGKTRSGKSSTMRLMIERLLEAGKPVCIIDPKGDWWGLKSSADGKSAGYPVVIFGGEHADVPINVLSGGPVAELVATGNRPCIIDLGGWTVADRTKFFIDFAGGLFRMTRGPRWLAIDECHNFAFQAKVSDPQAGMMLHWANRLASEGAGKGLTLISASQRPQKVHKDYLTSHETLVAMRVIHPLDRTAMKDWVDGAADKTKGKEVLDSIAEMRRGEGWVWTPEIGFGPERIQFPKFKTYDSFKAPSGEAIEKLKGWASVDLDDVRTKLAAAIEEAKANDPKELKAENARLAGEIRRLSSKSAVISRPDTKTIEEAEQRGYDRGEIDGHSAAIAAARSEVEAIVVSARQTEALAASMLEALSATVGLHSRAPKPVARPATSAPTPAPPREKPITPIADGSLTGPEQRILNSLATWEQIGSAQPSNAQVAWLAGYSPSSSSYTNPRGALKTKGLITYPSPGTVALTPDGVSAAAGDRNIDRGNLVQFILPKLPGPERRILEAAVDYYPSQASNAEVAAAAGYSETSSSYTNPRGALKTKELITYPGSGMVRAADWLFP